MSIDHVHVQKYLCFSANTPLKSIFCLKHRTHFKATICNLSQLQHETRNQAAQSFLHRYALLLSATLQQAVLSTFLLECPFNNPCLYEQYIYYCPYLYSGLHLIASHLILVIMATVHVLLKLRFQPLTLHHSILFFSFFCSENNKHDTYIRKYCNEEFPSP